MEKINRGEGDFFKKPEHKGMLPQRRKLYDDGEFYAQKGKPTECFSCCSFQLNISLCDETMEYQTLFLVTNSRIPYLRLVTRKKGKEEPINDDMAVSPKSKFALGDDAYRESVCPKVAWGLTAIMLWNARYFEEEDYFYNSFSEWNLVHAYMDMARKRFMKAHTDSAYASKSEEEKEQEFYRQHYKEETEAWERCSLLRSFPRLYEYAESLTSRYLDWLEGLVHNS